ncbi:MAG: hypothetical protein GQ559_03885, partial [Desulfobulbaceae bacterium]|nr:hypothetical protein [Desulfobulbaceae bacterium]
FCWNINSFDQEGVQLGKVLATRLLTHLSAEDGEKQAALAVDSPELCLLNRAGIV